MSNSNKDRTKTPEEARRGGPRPRGARSYGFVNAGLGGRGAGCHPQGGGGGAGLVVQSLRFDGLMTYHVTSPPLIWRPPCPWTRRPQPHTRGRGDGHMEEELALEEKELFDQARTDALV